MTLRKVHYFLYVPISVACIGAWVVTHHYLTAAIFGLLQVVVWHLHLSRAGRSKDKSLSLRN